MTDKVAIDQRFTQVESPQLIKQNTHYESPAFGSQKRGATFLNVAPRFYVNLQCLQKFLQALQIYLQALWKNDCPQGARSDAGRKNCIGFAMNSEPARKL